MNFSAQDGVWRWQHRPATLFLRDKSFKIFLLFSILILSGCSYLNKWKDLPTSESEERTIFVVSHGWHTGIVIPGNELGQQLSFLKGYFGEYGYYEFGWGDKDFYQAETITSKITLQAIIWPTESVMHIAAFSTKPNEYFPSSKTVAIKVSKKGLEKLRTSIADSFRKENGQVIQTQKGLYGRSLFFTGQGRFYITNTCNTWTARMLKTTGAPFSSFLTLTAGSVIRQSNRAVSKYECCLVSEN